MTPEPSDTRSEPIRAVFIDFGGVLYQTPNPQRMMRWLNMLGIRDGGALAMMHVSPRDSQLVMDIMTGKMVEQEVWDRLAKTLRVRPGLIRFFLNRSYSPRRFNRQIAEYLAGLRPRYRTAILTNAPSDFRRTYCQSYNLEGLVDQVIISAEERLAKPDPRLFELAAGRLGVTPAQSVFVDDMPENVEGAREAGMQALVHQDTAQTITWLRGMLG